MQKFEDILAWQKAIALAEEVYKNFKPCKDFGFKDQIQRASVSISNNIAEGFEKGSQKDFKHFLYIAKGSCSEVRSMTYLARNFNYVSEAEALKLREKTAEISKMLSGFIKTINTHS